MNFFCNNIVYNSSMKKIILLFLLLLSLPANAKHFYNEHYYQAQWCNQYNGQMEYVLPDKTRVDCLTKNYAVEFDFVSKWAECVGQALYYADQTNRTPACVLIIEKPKDFKYYYRIEKISKDLNLQLWYIKSPDYDNQK